MEMLEDKIKKFLAVDIDYGKGSDYGCGDGYGDIYYGYGCGQASGRSNSYFRSYGFGYGSGYGSGHGFGCSSGYGDGSGKGYGSGYGKGYDSGYGHGIKEIHGYKVHIVDDTQTIITSVRGNIAQGFILQSDLQLEPCYIVKENNKFAHGNTLRDAFTSLQEKLYDDSTEEERIEAFKHKFPSYDTKYDNRDLFAYHHVLTGSCRMGREQFVKGKSLSLEGKTTVREFVELTKNAYGGSIIKQLPQAYGITK